MIFLYLLSNRDLTLSEDAFSNSSFLGYPVTFVIEKDTPNSLAMSVFVFPDAAMYFGFY